jgi:hypothetical protein
MIAINTYSDSSSDSESDYMYISYPYPHNMTKNADVKQPAPTKPPKLSAGGLTPEVAQNWENACKTYFMHKGINAANQVKMIASGMADPCLHAWYPIQCATLDGGMFNKYMTALKTAWLETHLDTKFPKCSMNGLWNYKI